MKEPHKNIQHPKFLPEYGRTQFPWNFSKAFNPQPYDVYDTSDRLTFDLWTSHNVHMLREGFAYVNTDTTVRLSNVVPYGRIYMLIYGSDQLLNYTFAIVIDIQEEEILIRIPMWIISNAILQCHQVIFRYLFFTDISSSIELSHIVRPLLEHKKDLAFLPKENCFITTRLIVCSNSVTYLSTGYNTCSILGDINVALLITPVNPSMTPLSGYGVRYDVIEPQDRREIILTLNITKKYVEIPAGTRIASFSILNCPYRKTGNYFDGDEDPMPTVVTLDNQDEKTDPNYYIHNTEIRQNKFFDFYEFFEYSKKFYNQFSNDIERVFLAGEFRLVYPDLYQKSEICLERTRRKNGFLQQIKNEEEQTDKNDEEKKIPLSLLSFWAFLTLLWNCWIYL